MRKSKRGRDEGSEGESKKKEEKQMGGGGEGECNGIEGREVGCRSGGVRENIFCPSSFGDPPSHHKVTLWRGM